MTKLNGIEGDGMDGGGCEYSHIYNIRTQRLFFCVVFSNLDIIFSFPSSNSCFFESILILIQNEFVY